MIKLNLINVEKVFPTIIGTQQVNAKYSHYRYLNTIYTDTHAPNLHFVSHFYSDRTFRKEFIQSVETFRVRKI